MTVEPTRAPPITAAPIAVCEVCKEARPCSEVEVEDVVANATGKLSLLLCDDCAPLVAKTVESPPTIDRQAVAVCPFCAERVAATIDRVLHPHPPNADKACPGSRATVAPHCLVTD